MVQAFKTAPTRIASRRPGLLEDSGLNLLPMPRLDLSAAPKEGVAAECNRHPLSALPRLRSQGAQDHCSPHYLDAPLQCRVGV
jgi:hypothetical protein